MYVSDSKTSPPAGSDCRKRAIRRCLPRQRGQGTHLLAPGEESSGEARTLVWQCGLSRLLGTDARLHKDISGMVESIGRRFVKTAWVRERSSLHTR